MKKENKLGEKELKKIFDMLKRGLNLPAQLINNNCPSIEYRTRKEILNENLSDNEVNEYQQKIFSDPKVCQTLEWQNDDGYFGTRLHTAPIQVWR